MPIVWQVTSTTTRLSQRLSLGILSNLVCATLFFVCVNAMNNATYKFNNVPKTFTISSWFVLRLSLDSYLFPARIKWWRYRNQHFYKSVHLSPIFDTLPTISVFALNILLVAVRYWNTRIEDDVNGAEKKILHFEAEKKDKQTMRCVVNPIRYVDVWIKFSVRICIHVAPSA